ncbi:hypothetical protein GCM10011487_40120 [Steroidobacter agaridevorans]|uniref:N-acylneuraminate cytidylyltransferase n=1 Tax=Steroidobacter agaridevorans TaxID=2695856 RepID=A0A829YH08_9GAMM|nr:acylneuraminate cytidylyltransferase family protein [Steroidobacter agaridevorans]GFE82012.1 hypothetical protein GCM10011487_40120 [Steroidobacter agaridevorans]GFE85599.1 hypothetical protein GCM10011488_05530 [Steroidobacter agaridevorans]
MFRDSHPVLALIPARGGSKGVPRKNLAVLCGRPLLEYTVRAAVDCAAIDASYVSSDDAEILEVARRLDARAVERPPAFATDAASAIEVVRHFIETLPAELRARDPLIVYLQPTSPLRDAQHLDAAFELLARHGATTLMSVVELEKSPFKAFGLDERQRLRSLFDERLSNARRQDLPPTFLPNGAIYIFAVSDFLSRDGFPSNGSVPYVMSAADSIDIDTPDDLQRVERILGDRHG